MGGAWSLGDAWSLWGCLVQGVAWSWGGGIPACTEADSPPWTEFLTHATENITLPQTSFAGGKNSMWEKENVVGRAFTSDWSVNNFIIVCEKNF